IDIFGFFTQPPLFPGLLDPFRGYRENLRPLAVGRIDEGSLPEGGEVVVDEMLTDPRDMCGNLWNVPAVITHATFRSRLLLRETGQVGDVLIKANGANSPVTGRCNLLMMRCLLRFRHNHPRTSITPRGGRRLTTKILLREGAATGRRGNERGVNPVPPGHEGDRSPHPYRCAVET
ncbi:hypothetical protein BDN67DRAFT_975655, partial [Paxillus ammoniavirescens]